MAGAAEDDSDYGTSPDTRPCRTLPLAQLVNLRDTEAGHCVVTTINDRGRLADRTPLKALRWDAGTPVTISTIPTAGIVIARRGGVDTVSQEGHLRLPADVRHACRIHAGDRLLVVAHPTDRLLVAYTPSAISAMAVAYLTATTARTMP